MDTFQSENNAGKDERREIANQIEEQEIMLSNARKRYMLDKIDEDDFKATKAECNEKLRLLEMKLSELPGKNESLRTIEGLLDMVIQRYLDIKLHYKTASIAEKRKMIVSMYPKNLCFDGIQHRTPYLNTTLEIILQINRQLCEKNKGERYTNLYLSPLVARRGSFSNPFLEDLRLLAAS